jgi:hypothetical protein
MHSLPYQFVMLPSFRRRKLGGIGRYGERAAAASSTSTPRPGVVGTG